MTIIIILFAPPQHVDFMKATHGLEYPSLSSQNLGRIPGNNNNNSINHNNKNTYSALLPVTVLSTLHEVTHLISTTSRGGFS